MDTYNYKYKDMSIRTLQNSIINIILPAGITAVIGGVLLESFPVTVLGLVFIALWFELIWLFIPIMGILIVIMVSPLSYLSRQWLQMGVFHVCTAFGLAAFFLKILNRDIKPKFSSIDIPLIMIVPVLALSILATKPTDSIFSLKHLFSFYALIGFYFIVRVLVDSDSKFKLSYHVFVSVLVLGSVGILIELFFGLKFGGKIVSFEDVERVSGIAGRANAAGLQIASSICLLLPFLFIVKNKLQKIIISFFLVLSGLALAISLSRSSWIAAFFGGLFIIKVFKPPLKHVVTVGLFVMLVFIIAVQVLDFPVLERLNTLTNLQNMASGDVRRVEQLIIIKNILLEKPLLGVGWGNYQYVSNKFKPIGMRPQPELPPHSGLMMMAAESGFMGLLIYISTLLLIAKKIFEIRNYFKKVSSKNHLLPYFTGLTATLISFFIFQFFQPALFKETIWISLGMLVSLNYLLKEKVTLRLNENNDRNRT